MSPPHPPESKSFHDFERAGWNESAKAYHAGFHDLTAQAVGPMLDAVGAGQGTRLLDVATGPGYGAGAAIGRGAEVTAIDFSGAQLEIARTSYPGAKFQQGDAEALDFADGSFDAVIINFGLLHFAHPDQALAEAHRVLATGGRIAFTVWAPPEKVVGIGIVLDAIAKYGNPDVPLPPGPPFFRFSDPDECRNTLEAAGFTGVEVEEIAMMWRLQSPGRLYDNIKDGTVRTSALLAAQSDDARAAIRTAIDDGARAYKVDGGVELPMPAVMSSATRP